MTPAGFRRVADAHANAKAVTDRVQ